MSTKSSLLLTTCCHIYRDIYYQLGNEIDVLVIDATSGVFQEEDCIEIYWDSAFSVMIRAMLDVCDEKQLEKICMEHYKKHGE